MHNINFTYKYKTFFKTTSQQDNESTSYFYHSPLVDS